MYVFLYNTIRWYWYGRRVRVAVCDARLSELLFIYFRCIDTHLYDLFPCAHVYVTVQLGFIRGSLALQGFVIFDVVEFI